LQRFRQRDEVFGRQFLGARLGRTADRDERLRRLLTRAERLAPAEFVALTEALT